MMLLHHQLLSILIIIVNVLLVGLTIIHAAPSSSSSSSSSTSTRGRNNNNNNNNNINRHSSTSYRRCFDFSQSIFDETTTTTNNNNNNNNNTTPSQLFELLTQSTKCERCSLQNNNNNNKKSSSLRQTTRKDKDNDNDNKKNININKVEIDDESGLLKTYHVVIFLTDDRIEYISLAAALLQNNFTVTILHLQKFLNLESRILSRLTCEQEFFVKRKERLFLLEAYNNNKNNNNNNNNNRNNNNNDDDIIRQQQPNNNDTTTTTTTGNYSSTKSSSSSSLSSPSSSSVSSCRITSTEPYDACTIQTAGKNIQQIYSLFTKLSAANQPIPFPDVLIMDVTFVGGLLLSEVSFVPTVAIASPHALKLAIEHDPNWTPNLLNKEWSWIYRLYRIFCQRIHSLSLTLPFMALNAIRGRLGLYLRLLKTPIEYLNPVVALILEDVPSESIPLQQVMTTSSSSSSTTDHQWSQRAFVTGSLQPPCVPCLPPSNNDNNNNNNEQPPSYRTAFKKNKPTTTTAAAASSASSKNDLPPKILIWPSPEITPTSARSLIRGTILARDSLESYDECEWDSLSCRNVVSNFGIVWLEQQKQQVQVVLDNEINDDDDNNIPTYLFPEVVPSYVSKEKSVSLVDSLARHPQTIAVLAHCDSTSMVIPLFGISILCISHSERGDFGSTMQHRLPLEISTGEIDPREVAIRLLQILRERNNVAAAAALDDEDEENPDDGEESVAQSSSSSPPPSTTTTNPATNANAVDSLNGMARAVEVLRKVAQSHRIHGPWKSLSQMQKMTTRAAREALIVDTPSSNNDEYNDSIKTTRTTTTYDEEHPYDTFTVLVAWLVLLSCSIYVIIKDSFLAKLWPSSHHRRHHHRGGHHHHGGGGHGNNHHRGNNGEAFSDGLLSRMPDLDYAAAIFIIWCKEQLQIAPISDTNNGNNTATTTSSVGGNNDYNNANTPNTETVNPIGGTNSNQQHHQHSSSNRGHHHGQSNVRRRRKR